MGTSFENQLKGKFNIQLRLRSSSVKRLIKLLTPVYFHSTPTDTEKERAFIRSLVCAELGRRRAKKSISILIDTLESTEEYISADFGRGEIYYQNLYYDAVEALSKIGTPAVEPLIEALDNSDKLSYTRGLICRILGNIADRRAFEPVIKVLYENELSITFHPILEALLKIDESKVVDHLIRIVKDKKYNNRDLVIYALRDIGDRNAIEALIELGNDENKSISKISKEAIAEHYKRKGDALFEIGDNTGALEYYEKILKINNRDFWALWKKGEILYQFGEIIEATDYAKKAIDIMPFSRHGHNLLDKCKKS